MGIATASQEDGPRADPVALVTADPENVGAALEAARGEIAKLRGDLEYQGNRFRDELEDARAVRQRLEADLQARDADLTKLRKDLEAAENSAGEKARQMIRQAGHSPVPVQTPSGDKAGAATGEQAPILKQYRDLKPGPARLEFAQKHEKELQEALEAEREAAGA